VAFVGQEVYFRQCALERPAGGLIPAFIDFREGAPPGPLLARLHEYAPDAVLVFRPEIIPAGLFASLGAVKIGYLTEPLPRSADGHLAHPDLLARLKWLERVDPLNFDRIVAFDPLIADAAQTVLQIWRSLPLPVADFLYMDVRPRAHPPRVLFIGRSTEHREEMLKPAKQNHPLVHIGHGLYGEPLVRFFDRTDAQLNLHNNPYPSFENRVSVALAAGHLVISEPLSPTHGLIPGVDFLEVKTADDLAQLLDRLTREPDAFADVQLAGRRAAERFRASAVYPGLVGDAVTEVGASATEQRS
jgi:hypothetical protein